VETQTPENMTDPRNLDWHQTAALHAEHGKGDPFAAAVRATRMPMLLTDPRQIDNPIVYANDAFYTFTKYTRDEVIGRNCRFLQGPETDRETVRLIREAIARREPIGVDILNYRKDGSAYWNALYLSPVSNEKDELLYFFASQFDATERRTEMKRVADARQELQGEVAKRTIELEKALEYLRRALEQKKTLLHEVDHRVKNNLQMIAALIALQTRSIKDDAARAALLSTLARIEAIGTVHRRLYQSDSVATFEVASFMRDLVSDIVRASGTGNIEVKFDLQPLALPANVASPLALIVNELVTNAIKHGFRDGRLGTITVLSRLENRTMRICVQDDGVGFAVEPSGERTSGLRLTEALVRQVRGTLAFPKTERGTRVEIVVPVDSIERATGDEIVAGPDRRG
jgi:PAS domain S-box-containing protein